MKGSIYDMLDAIEEGTVQWKTVVANFYPDLENAYTWWSYRMRAREKNVGWRIDYFITSGRLKDRLQDAKIHTEIFGSDHCPVELDIL